MRGLQIQYILGKLDSKAHSEPFHPLVIISGGKLHNDQQGVISKQQDAACLVMSLLIKMTFLFLRTFSEALCLGIAVLERP